MAAPAEKFVHAFEEVERKQFPDFKAMKLAFGGKGAGLIEMTQMGLPIPEGFVIPCKYCLYFAEHKQWPAGMREQIVEAVHAVERKSSKLFGDVENPLLVSVRSGAPESMPGMMDTVLNLGMSAAITARLVQKNARFGWDAWRRFIRMFGCIVKNIPGEVFDGYLDHFKEEKKVKTDIELSAEDMKHVAEQNLRLYEAKVGSAFPQDPWDQLFQAINAVFQSWDCERAVAYRTKYKIPNYGTAVNIVRMVYGNLNDNSGTGVLFTRDPNTGEKEVMGEFLVNAQGEDVVAGIRTPTKLSEFRVQVPRVGNEIYRLAATLEANYRDMQDCEFTVEDGKVYFLQTRSGKRTATAAVKIAMDLLREGVIDEQEAVLRVPPEKIEELLYKRVSPHEAKKPVAKGFNASPGCVIAKAVFDCKRAIEMKKRNEVIILVRRETKPEDFPGMLASAGILTSRGGKTCHAAVVARGIGLPAVVGAGDLEIDEEKAIAYKEHKEVFREGDIVSIDGLSGSVYVGPVETVVPEIAGDFKQYIDICDRTRRLRVRANADTPQMAADALANGAEGIGLCRTERMFNAKDRLPKVVAMIVADNLEQRLAALDQLLPLQQGDFEGIFRAMNGKPVIVRLLDPPLHEFLPNVKNLLVEYTQLECKGDTSSPRHEELAKLIRKCEELHEDNGMLGHRGVRLGNTNPEIYGMQIKALIQALIAVEQAGVNVQLEIMMPMTVHEKEIVRLQGLLRPIATKLLADHHHTPSHPIMWGSMIETPRACLTAEAFGKVNDFFSFGTNDLTQTTFAFSRDDCEGRFLSQYIECQPQILKENPFEVLDIEGVGKLVRMAVADGRTGHAASHNGAHLEIGVCGETGGEPSSVIQYHKFGLDYVSCSPFRIPVARIAAAHAAVLEARGKL